MTEREVCIVAAWMTEEGIPVRGHRHCHCRDTALTMGLHPVRGSEAQGFMTSRGRFVGREEGMRLQKLAKARSARTFQVFRHDDRLLFSEDLY